MKLATTLLICAALAAQDPTTGRKHLSVAIVNSPRPVSVAALEIERGAQYPSIVHLKGAVEITMPVCVVSGPGNTHTCAADVIVHADEAYLHEDTGQIDTGGAASITRK